MTDSAHTKAIISEAESDSDMERKTATAVKTFCSLIIQDYLRIMNNAKYMETNNE